MRPAESLSKDLVTLGLIAKDRVVSDCIGPLLAEFVVPLRDQDNWCWAAVAVAVANGYGDKDPKWDEQCRVARDVKGKDCCGGDNCDSTADLEPALDKHFDNTAIPQGQERAFAFVEQCIKAGNPLGARVKKTDEDSGHFVLIVGHCVKDGLKNLWIGDPFTGMCNYCDFESFKINYADFGPWDMTFRTKK
jgi:hypothetical protein